MFYRRACLITALSVTSMIATTLSTLGNDNAAYKTANCVFDQNSTTAQGQSSTNDQQNLTHIQYSIRNGDVSSKGVNLGGWLVTEYWMSRSADVWQYVSEEDAIKGEFNAITTAADPDLIRSKLDHHHRTFITESDIADIAAAGLNTVRVPVGFWITGFDLDDPSGRSEYKQYSNGTLKYLDVLITDWAKKHNIAVLISIHAAKGSQNGLEHSSSSEPGKPQWSAYDENVANTITTVTFLADRYKDEDAFLGMSLLNEPSVPTDEGKLYAYYEQAYTAIRETGNNCVLCVAPLLSKQSSDVMTDFMQAPAYSNVWVERHQYFVWGYEDTSLHDLINDAVKVNFHNSLNQWNARKNHNRLFIGEWSFSTAVNFFSDNQEGYYKFCQAMMDVIYLAEGGFTFWSWKLDEDESGLYAWSLRSVLRDSRLKAILLRTST